MSALTFLNKAPVAFQGALPNQSDVWVPSTGLIAHYGAAEGAFDTASPPRASAISDRVTPTITAAVTPTGSNAAKAGATTSGLPYFDFSGAPGNEGYSPVAQKAAFGGLSALTIIALAGISSAAFDGTNFQSLFTSWHAASTNNFLQGLRADDVGTATFSVKRSSGAETAVVCPLLIDWRTYPILIAEADFANDRARLSEALTGKTTGWLGGMQGTAGAVSRAPDIVRYFGYVSSTVRNFKGVVTDQPAWNRLLTDVEKQRIVSLLAAKRALMPSL